MNPRNHILIGCLAFIFAGLPPCPVTARTSPFDSPPSSYLLLVNGKTVRERNPDLKRAPASLTKIMTALVVLENVSMDEVVTVSAAASRETGSRIGLRRGQKFKARDLLAATLIASANDAARALADHVAGNQRAFVKRMNEKAETLHLSNTRFTNACGHDQKGLYTTAHDLAVLADRALRIPLFADLVSRRYMRIYTLQGHRGFGFRNKNRLIGRYPGARGVKTGTTPKAGQCLVALAERGDTKVFLVIMNARNRWRTAPAMLDAGFAAAASRRE